MHPSSRSGQNYSEVDQETTEDEENYANITGMMMENTMRSRVDNDIIYDSSDNEEEVTLNRNWGENGGPWFTLDDVPPNRWRKRLVRHQNDVV